MRLLKPVVTTWEMDDTTGTQQISYLSITRCAHRLLTRNNTCLVVHKALQVKHRHRLAQTLVGRLILYPEKHNSGKIHTCMLNMRLQHNLLPCIFYELAQGSSYSINFPTKHNKLTYSGCYIV